jgi:hypothetical protein
VAEFECVPPHVWDFDVVAGEAFDGAWHDSEAPGAGGFLACLEEELVADADAKIRATLQDPLSEGGGEFETMEAFHAVAKGALSREDEVGGLVQAFGSRDQLRGVPERTTGIDDAAEVSAAVVDHSKLHA